VERSTTELTGRLAEYQRLAEQVRTIQDSVDEIRGTGYSDDDLVTAVVNGRGALVELELDPRIYRDQNSAELAAKIVAAVHDAAAEAEHEATKLAEKLVPTNQDDDSVDPVFDPVLQMLGDPATLEGRK